MIAWPQTLIREISRRRVVFFLGAGVSASSVDPNGNSPKDWKSFLDSAAAQLIKNHATRKEIEMLISDRRYLLALQAIADNADQADYQLFLNNNFNNPTFLASDLHKIIHALDSNIVITTNFDKIYDKYCETTGAEGYTVATYDADNLGDLIRTDQRLIIKAHGSISNIPKMIFTKSQYHQAKKDYPGFYEIIKAILLTHTCIFIGCGLEDPDVLLILEDVKITSSSTLPHYALMLKNQFSEIEITDWLKTYNIKALEYENNHSELITNLNELLSAVDSYRATRT